MKKLIFSIVLFSILQHSLVTAQNIVPNYSFEVDTACPFMGSDLFYAIPWFVPHTNWSSTDLYDTCDNSVGSGAGVPYNDGGYQWARTGVKYAGIIVYTDTMNYREYMEVPLLDTLIANRNYCVEFYISRAENSGYAISNLGAYISNDSLLDSNSNDAIDYADGKGLLDVILIARQWKTY